MTKDISDQVAEQLALTKTMIANLTNHVETRSKKIIENNELIENLTAANVKLESEVATLNKFMDQITKKAQELTKIFKEMGTLSTEISGMSSDLFSQAAMTATLSVAPPKNPKKEDVARAVREILEEAGTPVSRADLFRMLQERGIRIYGKDPEMVLSTMLWRVGEDFGIVNVKGHGYWLASNGGFLPGTTKIPDELG